MVTVGSLVADCGLELAAGEGSADRELRWVHISELEDPTPWLSGGELLLTTGIPLRTPARQRRFVGLLAERDVAALGFGTGFDHKRLPKALVDEAASATCRCSRCPTRCRSSRSPSARPPRSSTSITACSSAARGCTSGSSAW